LEVLCTNQLPALSPPFSLALICNLPIHAQTYRGGINGTVTDHTGAAIANANVSAVETATNTSYHAVSSSAGEFNFANLPVGTYAVTISYTGFSTTKYDNVQVAAGTSYILSREAAHLFLDRDGRGNSRNHDT